VCLEKSSRDSNFGIERGRYGDKKNYYRSFKLSSIAFLHQNVNEAFKDECWVKAMNEEP